MHHDGSLSRLDLIAEPSERSRQSALLVGFSDHRLLKAVLSCTRPPAPSVTYTYRDLKCIDVPAFSMYLQQSLSVTSLSEDPDEIVRQLDDETRSEDVARPRTNGYPQRRGKRSAQDVGWNGGMPSAVRQLTVGHTEELVEQ